MKKLIKIQHNPGTKLDLKKLAKLHKKDFDIWMSPEKYKKLKNENKQNN